MILKISKIGKQILQDTVYLMFDEEVNKMVRRCQSGK